MSRTRTPPTTADLLETLAASCEAGLASGETLALIARAGPASARVARQLSEGLRSGTLTAALGTSKLLAQEEQPVVALGEEVGRLPSSLRWAVERNRARSERRRAIRGAVIGPLLFAMLTLLAEPLPAVVLSAGTFWTALRPVILLAASATVAFLVLPRIFARAIRSQRAQALLSPVPLVGSLMRLETEASAAALIAAFSDSHDLALAPRAVRAVGAGAYADALAVAAADPLASVPTFSEPFALALEVGLRAGDLPTRLAAVHRAAQETLTVRLRATARVLAFTVLAFVALHGVLKLLSTPLPGLGRDLGGSPELRELERELENAGH
jgi:type II secretory pathway component PulF